MEESQQKRNCWRVWSSLRTVLHVQAKGALLLTFLIVTVTSCSFAGGVSKAVTSTKCRESIIALGMGAIFCAYARIEKNHYCFTKLPGEQINQTHIVLHKQVRAHLAKKSL